MSGLISSHDLGRFANSFFRKHTETLNRYVRLCIMYGFPYLGFIYCLSFLNLLGSLYGGKLSLSSSKRSYKEGLITQATKKYMTDLMRYSTQNANLIQRIFGQSVANIVQPIPVIFEKQSERYISWKLLHNYEDKNRHLELAKLKSKRIDSSGPNKLAYDHVFYVSLPQLLKDILNSIYKKRIGYLHLLRSDGSVRKNFRTALSQICEPNS